MIHLSDARVIKGLRNQGISASKCPTFRSTQGLGTPSNRLDSVIRSNRWFVRKIFPRCMWWVQFLGTSENIRPHTSGMMSQVDQFGVREAVRYMGDLTHGKVTTVMFAVVLKSRFVRSGARVWCNRESLLSQPFPACTLLDLLSDCR